MAAMAAGEVAITADVAAATGAPTVAVAAGAPTRAVAVAAATPTTMTLATTAAVPIDILVVVKGLMIHIKNPIDL